MHRPLSLLCLGVVVGCGSSRPPLADPVHPIAVSTNDAEAAGRDLVGHADATLGIVVVEDIVDTESETGPRRRATLQCGDELSTLAAELATYLAERPPPDESPGWSCADADCELPGMVEYDPNRILRFGPGSDGRTVVRGYFAIDALAVDPERLAHTRENADRDFHELSQHRCD